MIVKRWLALLIALTCATSAFAEEAQVADGLTISSWVNEGTTGLNNEEYTIAHTNAFTTNGTSTVTVHKTSHGHIAGDKFSIEDGATVDGLSMNGAWTIATVPDANSYTFTHTGTASGSTATTGSANITFGSETSNGKLRFICYFSHSNYDDPIKFYGTRGAAHLHTFFGNTLTNYASTYQTLRATGNGTCGGGPLNRTAYWIPGMINGNTNKLKYPAFTEWYYINNTRRQLIEYTSSRCASLGGSGILPDGRAAACPILPIKRLQRGQKAIFGYDPSKDSGTGGYPDSYASSDPLATAWACWNTSQAQQGGRYRYLHNAGDTSLGLTSNGSCPSDGYVAARVVSPTCWTGELDEDASGSPHYEHFAFAGQDSFGQLVCPATHPYRHIQFEVIVAWSYTGGIANIANWYLSSDRHNGATFEAGETFHWDMYFAWNDTIMDKWARDIMGMSPDSNDVSTYVYRSAGGGGNAADDWVGGKHIRNMNSGGLGVLTITPCDDIGLAASGCQLISHNSLAAAGIPTISDVEVDIPTNPGNTGKSKMH
jgi:hypothetical protein